MLGSPPLRAAMALAALLLLLVPLRSFTTARAAAATEAAAPTPPSPVTLRITSTKAPFGFSVSHLGKDIWQGESKSESVEAALALPVPKEGVDLAVRVTWRDGGLAAAKVSFSSGGNDPVERTVWGNREAGDVLAFP